MGNKQNNFINPYEDPQIIDGIERLNIYEFLDEFNIDYSLDGENIGENYIGVNPCPSCNTGLNHFAIHKERKDGTCWKCKCNYAPIKLMMTLGKMSFKKVKEYLSNYTEEESKDTVQRIKNIFNTGKNNIKNNFEPDSKDVLPKCRAITYQDLKNNNILKKLFKEKHLHFKDIKEYDIRIASNKLIFPIYLQNKQVSYQIRYINHKQYYIPTNLQNYFFNEDKILPKKPLILVEGFFDLSRINSYIRLNYKNQISVTSGGLKSLSNKQLKKLSNLSISYLIIMFDNDSWFDYYRIKNNVPFNVDFIILPKGKDPNELTWNEMKTIFEQEIFNEK